MRCFLRNAFDAIKYAPWLTHARLLRWGKILALISFALLVYDVAAHTATSFIHGRDFSGFWSNTVLAAAGRAEAAYTSWPHHTLDQSLTYPPIMMLLCWPLAHLPYGEALVVWLVLGTVLFAWSLSRLIGWPIAALSTFATPAAFANLLSGQNGYFSAVAIAWGLMLVECRPVFAGVLLGTLCCKPQLAVLLPVALIAGGYRRALAAAAGCAAMLVGASILVLGQGAWIAFFHRVMLQRWLMEVADLSWIRMPTVFAMVRLAGAGLPASYLVQGLSAVFAAIAVTILWHRKCPLGIKSAGLVTAIFLATPHVWDYDTVVLTFAAAWLAVEAGRTGFQPWEKIVVLVLLTLAGLSFGIACLFHLQIAPILLWLSLAVLIRRGLGRSRAVTVASLIRASPPSAA